MKSIIKQTCNLWGTERPELYITNPCTGKRWPLRARDYWNILLRSRCWPCNNNQQWSLCGFTKTEVCPNLKKALTWTMCCFNKTVQHRAQQRMLKRGWLWRSENDLCLYRTAHLWWPHSPDINPLDFLLWRHFTKHVRYVYPRLLTTSNVQSKETCHNMIDNYNRRLDAIITQN